MNAPTHFYNNRARVRDDPHWVILSLGDTTIVATFKEANEAAAKRASARYKETAERINVELDATGRMDYSRALDITCDVRRELDIRP